jgi:hypothetical protein
MKAIAMLGKWSQTDVGREGNDLPGDGGFVVAISSGSQGSLMLFARN